MKKFWKKLNKQHSNEWNWERMKLDFLVDRYNINSIGIAHVGGWKCKEVHTYKELLGDIPIVFVEANKKLKPYIDENLENYNFVRCEYVALGNKDSIEFLNLNFSNPDNDDIGQSSSILEPNLHPPIGTRKVKVEMTTADKLFVNDKIDFLSIDVQGYELEVLKGAKTILKEVKYIITEVNRTEQYKGCVLINDLDIYLKRFGFLRIETEWWGGDSDWGDAFYIKSDLIS